MSDSRPPDGYVLGVDLGTTYTAAAIERGGRVEVVNLGSTGPVIPSLVYLSADGECLVGEAAARRLLTDPERVASAHKLRIGDPTPLRLGDTPMAAHLVGARLLRAVVDRVTDLEGGPPREVVVTHPANWGEYRREAMTELVRAADLPTATLLPEPVAAAIAYADTQRIEEGEVVGVYDLGGGTFDAALVTRTPDGFEILGAPDGVDRLGGLDFDEAILSIVSDEIGDDQLLAATRDDIFAASRLRDACRDAKIALSSDTSAVVPVEVPGSGRSTVRITRVDFEHRIAPLVEDSVRAMHRTIESADLDPDDLARILLVGGASRVPLIGSVVASELERPITIDLDPKLAVARGAALHGATGRHTASPPRRRMPSTAVAALGLLAILVAVGFVLTRGDSSGSDESSDGASGADTVETSETTDTPGDDGPPVGELDPIRQPFPPRETLQFTLDRLWTLDPNTGQLLNEVTLTNRSAGDVVIELPEFMPEGIDNTRLELLDATGEPTATVAEPADLGQVILGPIVLAAGGSATTGWATTVDANSPDDLVTLARDFLVENPPELINATSGGDEELEDPSTDTTDPSDPTDDGTTRTTDDRTTGTTDDPGPTEQEFAPVLSSIGNQTSDELKTVTLQPSATDQNGDPITYKADGLPAGLQINASTGRISGVIGDAAAVNLTTSKNSIKSKAFAVTVTATDSTGRSAQRAFTWTVRDTHFRMPNYVNPPRFGCGSSCGEPVVNVASVFTPVFRGYFDSGVSYEEGTIWRQSIAPGTVVSFGQSVTIWYFDSSCNPCDQGIQQGHP